MLPRMPPMSPCGIWPLGVSLSTTCGSIWLSWPSRSPWFMPICWARPETMSLPSTPPSWSGEMGMFWPVPTHERGHIAQAALLELGHQARQPTQAAGLTTALAQHADHGTQQIGLGAALPPCD
jgi:hypothetical protein